MITIKHCKHTPMLYPTSISSRDFIPWGFSSNSVPLFHCLFSCFSPALDQISGGRVSEVWGGARTSILLVYIDDATVQDLLFTLPLLMLCSKIFSNSAHGKLWSNCVPPGETKKCQEQDFWTFCSREVSLPTVHFLRPSQEGWKYAKCTWHILTYWAKDAHFQWTQRNSHWNWEFIIFEICENTAFQSNRDIPRWIYNMTPHVRFPRRVVDRWSRKLISPTWIQGRSSMDIVAYGSLDRAAFEARSFQSWGNLQEETRNIGKFTMISKKIRLHDVKPQKLSFVLSKHMAISFIMFWCIIHIYINK